MGTEDPIPPNTMNVAAPEGTPPWRFKCRFSVRDSKKTALPSEAQNEAAERPHQGWDTSRTNFSNISNTCETAKNQII